MTHAEAADLDYYNRRGATWLALSRYLGEMEALPRFHHRRIGYFLIRAAAVIAAASICISIVAMNVAMALAALGCLLSRPPLHRIPCFAVGALFSGWISATIVIGIGLGAVASDVRISGLIHTWTIFLVGMIAFADRRTLRAAALAMASASLISAALASAQFFGGLGTRAPLRFDPSGPRLVTGVGFFSIHLTQGYVLAIAMLVFTASGNRISVRARLVGGVAAVAAVALSASRAAYLSLAMGIGAMIASRGARHIIFGGVIGLLLLGVFALFLGELDGRLVRPSAVTTDGRWAIWRTSLQIVREHPMLGVGGSDAFKAEYARVYPLVEPIVPNEFPQGAPHAHNSFLSIAAEHGIPALVLYVALMIAVLVAIRKKQASGRGWSLAVGVVASTMTAGCFEDIAGHSIPAYAFFLALAFAYWLPGDMAEKEASGRITDSSPTRMQKAAKSA